MTGLQEWAATVLTTARGTSQTQDTPFTKTLSQAASVEPSKEKVEIPGYTLRIMKEVEKEVNRFMGKNPSREKPFGGEMRRDTFGGTYSEAEYMYNPKTKQVSVTAYNTHIPGVPQSEPVTVTWTLGDKNTANYKQSTAYSVPPSQSSMADTFDGWIRQATTGGNKVPAPKYEW
jgi:hypothetical protein